MGSSKKIRVELQGYNECALATLAALADKPLNWIRETACSYAGVTRWADADPRTFWMALTKTAADVGLANNVKNWRRYMGTGTISATSLKGRGSIIIRGEGAAHAMAYENGLVYDPNSPLRPGSLEWMLRDTGPWSDWIVESITPNMMDHRLIDCPNCDAKAGRPCRYPSGYHLSAGHAERRNLAKNIYKEAA